MMSALVHTTFSILSTSIQALIHFSSPPLRTSSIFLRVICRSSSFF
jgi:hypothetical protein